MHAQKASITGIDIINLPFSEKRGHAYITVTPEIAKRWLEFNTANRAIIKMQKASLVRQMTNGMWRDNGDAIRFSPGKLLDGQHRLDAIVECGLSFVMSVEYGLDPLTQDTIDTGRTRTPRDVLSIEGLGPWESRTLGSAIHAMIEVDAGGAIYTSKKYSNAEARSYYLEHAAAIDKSLRYVRGVSGKAKKILPFAQTLILHYLFSRINSEQADEFLDKLFVGDGLSKTSAIFHLRNRLTADAIDNRTRSAMDRYGFVIKAWNSYRSGREMRTESGLYFKSLVEYPEIK